MFRALNIARYMLAIVTPIILLPVFGISITLCAVALLLFLNNYFDDVVFFFGYRKIDLSKNTGNGLSSPVNGTITAIERYVPLYSHLVKCDVLTKEVLVEKHGVYVEKACSYHHMTVFLNKFNHHIVGNVGCEIAGIKTYDMDGVISPMVEDGKLIADNIGSYLNNTFVEIVYMNGVSVMLTLDKYISKAVMLDDPLFPMFICKGSQCDIYIPTEYGYLPGLKVGSKLELFEHIADLNDTKNSCWSQENPYHIENASKEHYNLIRKFIGKIGVSHFDLLFDNLKKTLSSYRLFDIAAVALLLIIYPEGIVPYLLAVILLFYTDRCIKHLLYSVINISGYKPWMTSLYSVTHKLLTYGRERK